MMENIVESLTTEMMEHICDNLCKYPEDKSLTQEELDNICDGCKMGQFVCGICNGYNEINDLEKKQSDVLEEYRVIGTAEEVAGIYNSYIDYFHRIRQYEKIGTIEKCQEAVEKQKAKKPIELVRGVIKFYACPICLKDEQRKTDVHYNQVFPHMKWCNICGQKLDWSEVQNDGI